MLKVNAKTGEIYLYGVIGPEQWGGDVGDVDMIDALAAIGNKRAKVRINSPGGVVDTGIAIHSLLSEHKAGVDVINDGLCASIATVIAMAGATRQTTIGSRWMIHRVRGMAFGTVAEIERSLAQMRAYDAATVEIYMNAMAVEKESLESLLDAETWFSADEAVANGLATEKTGTKSTARPRVAAWFKNPPAELIAACADTEVVSIYPWKRELARLKGKF